MLQTFEIRMENDTIYSVLAWVPPKARVKIRNIGNVPVRVSSVEEQLEEGWIIAPGEILEIEKDNSEGELYARINNGGYTVLSVAYTA